VRDLASYDGDGRMKSPGNVWKVEIIRVYQFRSANYALEIARGGIAFSRGRPRLLAAARGVVGQFSRASG